MKKFILTVTLALAGLSAMAQGLINFQNNATTRYFTNSTAIGGTRGQLALTANSFVFALYYYDITANGMAGSSNYANYVFATSVFNSASSQGLILGNAALGVTPPGGDAVAVFTIGYSASEGGLTGYQTRFTPGSASPGTVGGWSGTSGFFGMSPVAYGGLGTGLVLATAPSPGVVMYSNSAGLIGTIGGGTDLLPVPEPSTFALAGLGAAAMLIFRRRK